ncbi:acid-sensing ion channel 1A isoform X2 [Nematostella vectensis]|uniref:acid-sensing ion channel 1A isoform X2 n=1 Tax=Nematostella vectensis TaxID=45351 RepID=UPI002076F343|nr:acid-sensing ion channel 1A isoform X2 [Nematostella vectensis]
MMTEWHKEMNFPAVTICNFNPISKSRYAQNYGNLFNLSTQDSNNIINGIIFLMSAPRDSFQKSKFSQFSLENYTQRGPVLGKSLRSYAHSIDGILSLKWLEPCKYSGKECGKNSFSTFEHLRYGSCHTFNSDGQFGLKVDSIGPISGLQLRLNVEEKDHVSNLYGLQAGFKVLVHDPREHPMIEETGFALQPGTHTFCSVRMKKYVNLKAPYRTECGENITDFNRYFNVNYTMAICSKQCLHDYGIKKCGCQPIFEITKDVPLCSLNDTFECIYPTYNGPYPREAAECFKKSCPVPCYYTKYETKLSYASAISNAIARDIPTYLLTNGSEFDDIEKMTEGERKTFFRENVASLDVYFDELSYDLIKQKPSFDRWSLIAMIGGYLGLFLGMSLLTVLEFFDLLVMKLLNRISSNKKVVNTVTVEPQESQNAFAFKQGPTV